MAQRIRYPTRGGGNLSQFLRSLDRFEKKRWLGPTGGEDPIQEECTSLGRKAALRPAGLDSDEAAKTFMEL